MFNSEFFPTPTSVLDLMDIDCYNKICLEPSAGKGDIIDYLTVNGATQVLCCELNKDLAKISQSKGQLIANDFFKVTSEQVSHVNLIVMNPPFSCADRHILHAFKIAPEGCEIISLCNFQTIDKSYGYGRSELRETIANYGNSQNLKQCFSSAERKTDVEVGLIRLFKPVVSSNFNWDGFFYADTEQAQTNGLISYNEVRAIVNTYVAAVNCFEKANEIGQELTRLVGRDAFTINVGYENIVKNKEQFVREFQYMQWKKVFEKLNIGKFVTKGVMEDINKFIDSRLNYPFTMKNIYRMIEIIVGTRESTMNKAITIAIDNFTRHTHENRYGVEGWKTNEGHLLNKKFITNYISESNWNGALSIKTYSFNFEQIADLTKAICFIIGYDYSSIPNIELSGLGNNDFKSNTWYEWGFFEFKLFKKGTAHFKFKDEKVWELLNRTYSKIKGQVLPEKL